jgi:hypothetical protein
VNTQLRHDVLGGTKTEWLTRPSPVAVIPSGWRVFSGFFGGRQPCGSGLAPNPNMLASILAILGKGKCEDQRFRMLASTLKH